MIQFSVHPREGETLSPADDARLERAFKTASLRLRRGVAPLSATRDGDRLTGTADLSPSARPRDDMLLLIQTLRRLAERTPHAVFSIEAEHLDGAVDVVAHLDVESLLPPEAQRGGGIERDPDQLGGTFRRDMSDSPEAEAERFLEVALAAEQLELAEGADRAALGFAIAALAKDKPGISDLIPALEAMLLDHEAVDDVFASAEELTESWRKALG
ncbi:MAG: hypothetical protein AAGA56_26275 [Myxococcota bacterium]